MAPRPTFKARRFQEILAGAISGDVTSLRAVYAALPTEGVDTSVLDVILAHISVEPPADGSLDYTHYATAGTLGLLLLHRASNIVQKKKEKHTQHPLAKFYVENVDSVATWIGFSLRSGVGFLTGDAEPPPSVAELCVAYSRLLKNMIDLEHPGSSTSPLEASLQSPTFCRVLFHMWTARDVLGGRYPLAISRAMSCSTTGVVATAMEGGGLEDSQVFAECFGRDGFSAFAKGAVDRVRAGSRLIASPHPQNYTLGLINTVLSIINCLGKAVPYIPGLFEALTRRRYLKHIAHFLKVALEVAQGYRTHSSHLLHALYSPFLQLSELARAPRCRTSRNLADIISGGLLDVLCHALENSDEGQSPMGLRPYTLTLSSLGGYTLYPAVLLKFNRTYPDGFQILEVTNPAAEYDWQSFKGNLVHRDRVMKGMLDEDKTRVVPRICDNAGCKGTQRERIKSGAEESKHCFGCLSVVYCSPACQKEDRNRIHRAECSPARQEFEGRRETKGWYSHTSRAYHLALLETMHASNNPKPGALTVLDYATTGEGKVDHRSVEGWWSGKGMDACDPPDYLRPRFGTLMQKYRKSQGELSIAEIVLPALGREEAIYLTVLLKGDGGEGFQAVFSAVRYGTSNFETI